MTRFMTQISQLATHRAPGVGGKFATLCMAALLSSSFATVAHATVTAPTGNLLIGLDGDLVTLDGTDVTTWLDQATLGGADNFIQDFNTPARFDPTLLTGVTMPNGTTHNVVDFDGAHTLRLKLDPNMDNVATQTWFMVLRFDDPVGNPHQMAYGVNTSANNTKISTGLTSGNLGQIARDSIGAQDVNAGTPPIPAVAGEWYLLTGKFNMTASPVNGMSEEAHAFQLHDSTGSQISSNTRLYVDGLPGTHDQSLLGNRGDGHAARFMDGAIAEFLFYNDILDSTETIAARDYLLDKYFNAPTAPDGDFDGDLDVDGNDFLIWQRGGSPNGATAGDLQLWQDNFGEALSVPAIAAVPEPTSILLLGFGSLLVLRTHRTRRMC